MSDIQINTTPIALTATYDDYLLVFDLPATTEVKLIDASNSPVVGVTFTKINDFYYMYNNVAYSTSHKLKYTVAGLVELKNITPYQMGSIYWYTSPIQAGTTITFPQWIINKITI
jgi:hypothetical protein